MIERKAESPHILEWPFVDVNQVKKRKSQKIGHKWIWNIKHVIFEPWKNIYFSTYPPPILIHFSHRFTSASKPAAYKSFDCCFSHFPVWMGIICDFRKSLREFFDPVVNRFTRQTLPTVNRKLFFMNILCIDSFFPQTTHNIAQFMTGIRIWAETSSILRIFVVFLSVFSQVPE
jgi:hypothetical protein